MTSTIRIFTRLSLAALTAAGLSLALADGAEAQYRHGVTQLKTGVENLSGHRMDNVRVHRNTNSRRIGGSKTYGRGNSIRIAPGSNGRHLAHEPSHVVQQKSGRVPGRGGPGAHAHLEREAEALRKRKARRASTSAKSAKSASFSRKAKNARAVARTHQAAKAARHANTARKAAKAANTARNVAKVATAGTGVGAVVGVTAGLAGVDPLEMATLKATNPAEYNRRMRALKKNPTKYMADNVKKNSKKVASDVGNAAKKAGCGIGNIFKKKGAKAKC